MKYQGRSTYAFASRVILALVLIPMSVGLVASTFMAQTPAGAITRPQLGAVLKSFGQVTDCGPAALDPTFGGTGKVTTDFLGFGDYATSVAIQADGKIVTAGYSYSFPPDFALVRYNTDGSLDTSFGGTGKVTTDVISYDIATSVAIQADGRIVVAGYGSGSDYDFGLVRYNTDGSLDASFGGTGKVITDFLGSQDFATSVAIQADGKIVAAGLIDTGSNHDFALVRYNTDGSLDTSFGGTGKVTTDFGGSSDSASSVAILPGGRIVAAGESDAGSTNDFALVRYNADGSLDTSFGGSGKVTTDVLGVYDYAASVTIQADGKIVAAGTTATASDYDFALVRYNSDGSLDTSFGGTGKVTTDFVASYDFAASVAVQGDDKIVVAGYTGNPPKTDFALVRYNSDGSLDTSFGGTGRITTDFFRSDDEARSVAIQANGKIVTAGYSYNRSNYDVALARYGTPCGSPTPTPTPAMITVKVGTTPTGRSFSVDGTPYISNQTFSWVAGSSHTIATTSPQSAGTGIQYVWTNWSDNGTISHVVAPTTNNARFVANFQLQYFLTMAVSGNGQVRPVSAWQNAGNVVAIQAKANPGSLFSCWTGMGPGSFTGTTNPASVTMNGPITETATFSP